MKGKKGSTAAASDVSILIIIIALMILAYVILLPPAEREALINADAVQEEGDVVQDSAKVLLSASPGKVFSYSTNVKTIDLEPVHVYKKQTRSVVNLVKSLYVNKNLLQDGYKEVYFDIDDVNALESLKLIMLVSDSKGPILINFNDRVIFEGVLTSAQMPIDLTLSAVKEQNNKIELSIPLPRWKLFSTNYYELQDIGLIKESKEEKASSVRSFLVDTDVAEHVSSAELRYYLNCNNVEEQGRLTVSLDGKDILSDTIFCQYTDERIVPLPREQFKGRDRHRLEFSIDKGDYNIDEPRVKVKLAKSTYPSYVFEVDSDTWDRIDDSKVTVHFKLKDDGTRKRARILIQDNEFAFDTTKGTYSKDITKMLDDGANIIKIIPETNFEINNLKIYWE